MTPSGLRTVRTFCALVVLASLSLCGRSYAAEGKTHVRAGVHHSPPFVLAEGGRYSGMAVDIWRMLEENLDLSTEYVPFRTVSDVVAAAANGDVDLVLTNLTVTLDRARHVKFTYPWYDAGLRIMIRGDAGGSVWSEIKNNGHLVVYAAFFALILVLSVLLTFVRRRIDRDFPGTWREGFSLNLYDLVAAFKSGNVDLCHLGWFSCVLSAVWMLFGVAFIAYVTSSVTTSMTKVAMDYEIRSLTDLPGRRVGAFSGSVSQLYLDTVRAQTVRFDDINDSTAALLQGEVEAIVADAPILEYWTQVNPRANVKVVGNLFHPDKYAFAANAGKGTLADRISVEIIRLHETGVLKELRERYFGRANSQ